MTGWPAEECQSGVEYRGTAVCMSAHWVVPVTRFWLMPRKKGWGLFNSQLAVAEPHFLTPHVKGKRAELKFPDRPWGLLDPSGEGRAKARYSMTLALGSKRFLVRALRRVLCRLTLFILCGFVPVGTALISQVECVRLSYVL